MRVQWCAESEQVHRLLLQDAQLTTSLYPTPSYPSPTSHNKRTLRISASSFGAWMVMSVT